MTQFHHLGIAQDLRAHVPSDHAEEFKKISREYLAQRFEWIDKQLAGKQYLMGDTFTVADAYIFTVLRWSPRVGIDLSKWPNIEAYLDRVGARPKVKEAMKAEGLLQ